MQETYSLPGGTAKRPFSRNARRPAATLCFFALSALLFSAYMSGCSASTPEKTVREFIGARVAGNDRLAAELTVEGELGDYPGGEQYLGESDIAYQVGEVEVDGDRARVTVAFRWDGQEVEVSYAARRVGSKWKLSLRETLEEWLPAPESDGQ